jgi:hypothetical protein
VGKLRLTQGLDFKNEDDAQSDQSIREKINALLARIPDEFELEENLTEILKLVLDQELQVKNLDWAKQVLHSQCSLRKNPKFLQNFRPKNNTLKDNF